MKLFLESGCDRCRSHWQSWSDQPKLLGQSIEYKCLVYRCEVCGTYWEEGLDYPSAIDPEEARRRLPWLTID
jgi:hypothetical protein